MNLVTTPSRDSSGPRSTPQSHRRRRSSLSIVPGFHHQSKGSWSATQQQQHPSDPSSFAASGTASSSPSPAKGTWTWLRRRSSFGAAEQHRRQQLQDNDTITNGTAAPVKESAGLSPQKGRKNNWRARSSLIQQHSSLSPSVFSAGSASRPTNRSPPPVVRVDSIPTLPSPSRLTFAQSVTGQRSAETSPLLGLKVAEFSERDRGNHRTPPPRSPVQGLGLSVESRYSLWGTSTSASRSQDSLSLHSEREAGGRNTASLSQGKSSPLVGRGGERHIADMSGRRRSISASNAHLHEPYRSHDTEAGPERHKMPDVDNTDAPRARDRREQDKKTMLSKALQKAHTAVLLDNAHNFEGAIEAYDDACRLLGHVLVRSTGEDDRRKLDAIRTTYTNRIQELHQINRDTAQAIGKNLPARPMSDESLSAHDTPHSHRSLEPEPRQEQALNGQSSTVTRSSANTVASQQSVETELSVTSQPRVQEPPQQPSQPAASNALLSHSHNDAQNETLQPATFKSTEQFLTIGSPMDPSYAPPPLSPRRMPQSDTNGQSSGQLQPPLPSDATRGHSRGNSGNSISWLDTIDESGGSSDGSSVHSLREGTLNRKHVRLPSGDTEAEFDAALDAAVEAAYADGLEPYDYDDQPLDYRNTILSEPVKQMVDTERKRLSDRSQIIQQAHARTKQLTKESEYNARRSRDLYRLSDDAEEERILEEIQKDFGFDFGLQSKSSMPRQSDSSEYSGASTYHSSMSSSKATAITSLSTVSEMQDLGSLAKPSQNLPRLSEESSQRDSVLIASEQFGGPLPGANNGGVWSRRMSGQNTKQLKIETSMPPMKQLPQPPPTAPPTTLRIEDVESTKPLTAKSDTQLLPDTVFQGPSQAAMTTPLQPPPTFVTQSSPSKVLDSPSVKDALPTPTTPAPILSLGGDRSPGPDSKAAKDKPTVIKKNKSSISLKTRNMSISSPDGSEVSVGTPLSTSFTTLPNNSKKNLAYTNAGVPPPPSLPSFSEGLSRTASNVNLFEGELHSPYVPGSPSATAANAPIPLEPCPDSHLLRPYWLMRCFYQTIAHPRGGYLSTKLFVPRDVWRVKGVKIKAMEEKIASCDNLTASLQKLNNVDSFDATAVLEEMQQFETVLDQVQSSLSKKLGSDVSVQGVQTLFKDAPLSGEGVSPSDASSSGSRAVSQGKSFLSSMRKLRSKNSGVSLANPTGRDPANKDSLTMSTLPMTNLANPRFAKRDVGKLEVSGPHAQYMESLAKLCDAVQVIDQIARQVEDPGLKHSSPTHVGLELSTRHASEFFGFFICRFVLTDLTMLLDKFIKRGSEWVLV